MQDLSILDTNPLKIKSIEQIKQFLESIFGIDFLKTEIKIAKTHLKRSHLKEVNIHPAAKWWNDLNKIISQGNRINPAIHSQGTSLMESVMLYYALDTLLKKGVISLEDPTVISRLKDRKNFLSYTYELFLAANYASNGYFVKFPEAEESQETVDLYIYNDEGLSAYIECKKLNRKAYWDDVALQIIQYLNSFRPTSYLISATFSKAPKSSKEAIEYGKEVISALKGNTKTDIKIRELPIFIIGHPDSLFRPPSSPDVEYYTFQFHYNPMGIISEPKIIIFRNTGKLRELKNSLNNRLKKASKQLKVTTRNDIPKLIAVDITSFVREVRNPWSLNNDETIAKQLDFTKTHIRNWLSKNTHVTGVIVTRSKLYLNPYNYPLALVMEPEYIFQEKIPMDTIPLFKGWSIVVIAK